MDIQLFNPFENLFLNDHTCFLSGADLTDNNDKITVFPEWILDRYNYGDRRFEMMDSVNSILYKDLYIPCSQSVKAALDALDIEVRTAFDQGYEAIKTLDSNLLFLWVGRMVYGTLYHELTLEKKLKERVGKEFQISPLLRKRFSYFHLMLQALTNPFSFGELKPWSIAVVRVKYSTELFNYRDDSVNLLFSLGVQGFGLIVSLQDNGILKTQHQEILNKIGDTELHPIQFEELCARFQYSKYLLREQPKYNIAISPDLVRIEALPLSDKNKLFKPWDNDMFGQVLEDYWSPWGLKKNDFTVFPNPPISFLEAPYSLDFIQPENIKLDF